jgi:glyoxylase-like metal-dependent hydrolase (beta-lactamase superfamily II)
MMTGPGTNSYLVGHQELVVIDPGPDLAGHRAALVESIAGRPVTVVAVTHTHPDHAPGAASLARVLGAPTASFADADGFIADEVLVDGALLGEGPGQLEVVHTPGHASAHCCFVLASERICFTGDHVMEGSTVVIRPPDGHMTSYLASLERLAALDPALLRLAPGHGRIIGDPAGAIAELLSHRRERERLVSIELASRGPSSAGSLVDACYPGLEERRWDVAAATLLAHLEHLVELGQARLISGGTGPEGVYEAVSG